MKNMDINKSFVSVLFMIIFSTTLFAGFFSSTPDSRELYIKYTNYPKVVYTQQRFSVDIEAIILTSKDKYNKLITNTLDGKNIELLDQNITWIEHENNTYTTTLHFKAETSSFVLPTLQLVLFDDDSEVNKIDLEPVNIDFRKIAINEKRFSNIIADSININSVKVNQYNNSMLMVVCNIEAINGNLEEFHLDDYQEQGMQEFVQDGDKQSMYYYFIVPNHVKSINFDYYNPKDLTFVQVELPVSLEDDLISTQTDLNPQDGSFIFYKKIFYITLGLLFVLVYIKTKYKISLLLAIIFFGLFISLMIPNKKVFLENGTNVYVLPTNTSTIFRTLDKRTEVEELMTRENFVKVLFQNKNIGWVKESDIK